MVVDQGERRGRELVVIEGEHRDITPLLSPQDAKAAMAAYQAIVAAVTDDSDYQTFKDSDGKSHKFRKRSGWKKLGRFYGVTTEVKEERIFHAHNPATCLRVKMPETFKDVVDCGCPVKGVRYVVRALDLRSGRYAENIGICVAGERRVPSSASLHDLATRALNRGENRAVADLLGVSDPSAEEVRGTEEVGHVSLSLEEQRRIGEAWKTAGPVRQAEALDAMRKWGFKGEDRKALFAHFNEEAEEADVDRLVVALEGPASATFDPDTVPTT